MRQFLVALVILCGVALSGTAANAQNYPWCAQYGGRDGGAQNCGFSTFGQCMAALSGNGGFCNRNTQYTGGGPYRRYHGRNPYD